MEFSLVVYLWGMINQLQLNTVTANPALGLVMQYHGLALIVFKRALA